jgi:polyisoprenyl-teichoic acid--peptidoglycan teichoic acid transferase
VTRRSTMGAIALVGAIAGLALGALPAPPAASAPVFEIGRAHGEFAPQLDGNEPIFILILGSDARPGTPMERGLCDSIHILGIDPAARRATLVGIPRDSYVPLATGGSDKINAALPRGGPDAMVQTVENLTGITFDYWVLTSFEGFTRLFDAVGGVDIDVPYGFTGHLGTSFETGKETLTGAQALEYSRTRKTLRHGDFDRSMNQGRILLAALGQFRKEFERDPATLFRWIGAGLRNTQTQVPLQELMTLAFTAIDLPAKRITNLVAVGSVGSVGTKSVVNLPDPHPVFQDVAADGFVKPKDIPPEAAPAG